MRAFKERIKDLEGCVFEYTYATNVKNVDWSLEECGKYITSKLAMEGSDAWYTIDKEQKYSFTKPANSAANGVAITKGAIIQYEAKMTKFDLNILWQQYSTA